MATEKKTLIKKGKDLIQEEIEAEKEIVKNKPSVIDSVNRILNEKNSAEKEIKDSFQEKKDKDLIEKDGIKIRILYLSKETSLRKFISKVIFTIEDGEIPMIKVFGNEAIAKLAASVAFVEKNLRDKYNLSWVVRWDKEYGKKNGKILNLLVFIGIFSKKQ
jgi:hypothetical protein